MRKQGFNLRKLDKDTLKVLNRITRGGVNYLSGTMAPAKSNVEENDIESLAEAFKHYADRGVEEVVVQVKYMGSRAQVYVNRDIDKCYAVSRNGYFIKRDLGGVFQDRWEHWFGEGAEHTEDLEMIIEDGELMPWSVLGKGLIEDHFKRYSVQAEEEFNSLFEASFPLQVGKTITNLIGEKRSDSEHKNLNNLLEVPNSSEIAQDLIKYKKQVEKHGEDGEPYFKPFNILKKVYRSGQEEVVVDENLDNYMQVGQDVMAVVNTKSWDESDDLNTVLEEVLDNNLEGVVIKPLIYDLAEDKKDRYAPYIKCRQAEYLRLVYGPHYRQPDVLKALVEKKDVQRKLGASIKEYGIGKKLLAIPVHLLDNSNQHYKELVGEALVQFKADESLDPRL